VNARTEDDFPTVLRFPGGDVETTDMNGDPSKSTRQCEMCLAKLDTERLVFCQSCDAEVAKVIVGGVGAIVGDENAQHAALFVTWANKSSAALSAMRRAHTKAEMMRAVDAFRVAGKNAMYHAQKAGLR
jgi:hypothetical protein